MSTDGQAEVRTQHSVKVPLKQEMYDRIREEIVGGNFLPGDLLKERQLAAKYGVSKTPVREALLLLQQEEMVKAVPRAGYMVTQLTMRDVQEVYQLRLTLEAMAARLAAERITDQELQELEKLISPSDPDDAVLLNHQFHLGVARASGNSRLPKMIEGLLDDTDRWDPLVVARLSADLLLVGHQAELDALKTRDPDIAERAIREHIERIYRHLSALYP